MTKEDDIEERVLIHMYIPGIYPATLDSYKKIKGLYYEYLNFKFKVRLKEEEKFLEEIYKEIVIFSTYKTSCKFLASLRGESNFFRLTSALLSTKEMDGFRKDKNLDCLIGKPCYVQLEEVKSKIAITNIYSTPLYHQ